MGLKLTWRGEDATRYGMTTTGIDLTRNGPAMI